MCFSAEYNTTSSIHSIITNSLKSFIILLPNHELCAINPVFNLLKWIRNFCNCNRTESEKVMTRNVERSLHLVLGRDEFRRRARGVNCGDQGWTVKSVGSAPYNIANCFKTLEPLQLLQTSLPPFPPMQKHDSKLYWLPFSSTLSLWTLRLMLLPLL